MLKLNGTFQQGSVLSPLRDSPLQSKDETRSSKSLEEDPYFDINVYLFLTTHTSAKHLF